MSVDAKTVRRIAHLARVAVAEDEVEHLRGEINAILAFVEQLSEVDVDGVEPMTSVTPDGDEEAGGRGDRRRRQRRDPEKCAGDRAELFSGSEGGGMTHPRRHSRAHAKQRYRNSYTIGAIMARSW